MCNTVNGDVLIVLAVNPKPPSEKVQIMETACSARLVAIYTANAQCEASNLLLAISQRIDAEKIAVPEIRGAWMFVL